VPENAVLTPSRPVTLSWDNGQGVRFERVVSIDEHYMFTITQRVVNGTDRPITLVPYGLVSRHGTPATLGFFILHEGPLGVFDGRLREFNYADLKGKTNEFTSTGGWIGVTDKYWLVSVAATSDAVITGRFRHAPGLGPASERYQVDLTWGPVTVEPGATGENVQRVFAGAKQLSLLDGYARALGITQFDLAIDKREIYAEAKGNGFDTKIIRKIIALKKMDEADRQEQDELLRLYRAASGIDPLS
jgi:YidC/Oxa1 family membrane protein insertase